MASEDVMLPGEAGLGDDIAARLDGIGCLALRISAVIDPAARDLCLEAIAAAVDSIKPKGVESQTFSRLRSYQGGAEGEQ
jgi:hypothetical protein